MLLERAGALQAGEKGTDNRGSRAMGPEDLYDFYRDVSYYVEQYVI